MGDKLENIPLLLGLARHAKRVLWQNLIYNENSLRIGMELQLPE
jgi:hypothetical protein